VSFEQLEARFLLSAQSAAASHPTLVLHRGSDGSVPFATSSPNGLTPTQIRHAYGFDQILIGGVQGDGTGQTIAIIDAYDDPTIVSDLHNFDAYWTANGYNLPDPPSFIRVAQNGTTNYPGTDPAGAGNPNGTWEMETSLDVEWAHALAPNANILLVEATSASNSNLMTAAVGYAKTQSNVSLITMSFGQNEFSGETSFDSLFTTPSGHTGITFLASTGDFGQPSGYPAFSPNVVGVGGTTLNVDGAGNILSESGWSGSGGSVSTMESQPSYQNGVVSSFSTTARTNPDVAFDADPNTGVPVYDSWDFGSSTPWQQFGGTSFSSPSWAALIAVADQARVAAGLTTLDGRSQTLPKLYSLSADFNDIQTGNNGFQAGVGYDLVTGLGTPMAALLVNDLVGVYTVTSSTPANGAIVSTPPVDFAITLATPYTPSSVQAGDLSVNGIAADSFTLTNSSTVTFHYATSPVSAQGLETISMPAGAITRQTDGAPVAAFNASFRYDAVLIAVDGTTPANGSTVTLPLTSLAVHFNEAYAAASIGVNDLTLSQGSVSSFALTDPQTVTYNLTGISNSGTLTINMAAGAVTDSFGNSGAAYSGSLVLVKAPTPFPTPLAAVTPAGSLIYQSSTSGTITSGGSDTYTLSIAAGQTLTVLVTPASGLQALLNVTGPGISSSASSASAGAPAVLQALAIGATSTYSFIVSGLGGTTGSYTIQAYLNATLSTATVGGASNHTLATAQNIDSSFIGLNGTAQRGAVMGTVTSSIGPDGFGYSGVEITPQFVDISGTGTATLVGVDDGNTRLRSNNLSGFTFKLYNTTYNTNFFINSNGMITFGSGLTGSASYSNTDLTSAPSQAIIAPLWDDWVITGGSQSAVYWQVQGSGASQRFIVQWNDVSTFQGAQTGQVTFEVILNADGTMIFNYKNLNSGDSAAGGATATVGIKDSGTQGGNRLLVSLNSASSPYVATGKSLEIGVGLTATATDFYAFTLAAGQTMTLAATGQKSSAISVSLENSQGTTLASGTSPGGGSSVGSIIDNLVAPSAGTYYAVVTGTTGASYSLVVNRDADFGTETNGSFASAQSIGAAKGVLGDILAAPASPTENWYSINATAGSELLLQTITPGSATAQFTNGLVPRIELYSPSDVLLASGQGAGNQSLSAVVNSTGAYRIRVFGANSTSGEYFLSAVIDAAPPTASITAVSPNPRNTPLSQLQIVFNKPVTGVSLANFSLTSGGGPNLLTSAQTLTTSDNITYVLGNLGPLTSSDGNYSISLAASPNITDSSGGYLASGAAASFIVDTTPPTVSISAIIPSPRNSAVSQIQINFSEPVTGFTLASLTLAESGGPNLLTSSQTLTTSDNTTFTLGNLVSLTGTSGDYQLTLTAAGSGIADLAGNMPASGATTSFIVDTTPPEVQSVLVSGIDWNPSFLSYLETSGLGTAQAGFQIPAGATQLSALPWSNVTTLAIQFTEDVSIDAANAGLTLIGSPDLPPPPSLASAAFSYSHAMHTATWTFDSPLPGNKYLLSIPAAAVTDALGSQLDGEWTNPSGSSAGSQFPSGNGTAGGDFNFRFNVLPGDVDQDGAVTGSDGNALRNHLLEDTSSSSYSAFSDLNADGAVTGLDGAIVRMNLLQSLPASDPLPPAGGNQGSDVGSQGSANGSSASFAQPIVSTAATSNAATASMAAAPISASSKSMLPAVVSISSLPVPASLCVSPASVQLSRVQFSSSAVAQTASIRQVMPSIDSANPTPVARHVSPRTRSATAADDLQVRLRDLIFEQLGQRRDSLHESFLV
jgi:Dockerin type I domain/Bacterial Ig-like domain